MLPMLAQVKPLAQDQGHHRQEDGRKRHAILDQHARPQHRRRDPHEQE